MPLEIRRPCQETSVFICVYLHGSNLVILFCFSSEDYSDKSGRFFPSLGYVFHWKVVNHLKLPFFIGSGIFLAFLTLFVSLWWYLSFPAIFFYPLSVIVLHILCSLPVCFRAFVISSRKPLNSKRTRDASSLPACHGAWQYRKLHIKPVCPCKLFKKKFRPGFLSWDSAVEWIQNSSK